MASGFAPNTSPHIDLEKATLNFFKQGSAIWGASKGFMIVSLQLDLSSRPGRRASTNEDIL